MSVQATLRYTEALVREAALASWRRAFGVRFVVALAAVFVCLAYLVFKGDRSWFIGAMAAVLVLGTAFAIFFYVAPLKASLHRLSQMQSPEANFRADAEGFSLSSELGSSTLPWSSVQRVWRYGDFWILVLSKTSQLTIPLAGLSEEDRVFILQQVAVGGASVDA